MAELWTIQRVLHWTTTKFEERGKRPARLEAEVLLAHVLGCDRVRLYMDFERPLAPAELTAYRELVKRRLAGEPSAYLTGKQEFWSLPLKVDASVLIPRRDTKTLIEVTVEWLKGRAAPRVIDVATGSGAIALALAKQRPDARIVATEVSAGALKVARENARPAGNVMLVRADLLSCVAGPLDLVVSNPPYVRSGEIDKLAAEVKYEPRLALDGGIDGLDVYRRLIPAAAAALTPGGMLALEIGHDQARDVLALCSGAGLVDTRVTADLAGNDRVVTALAPPA